MIHPEVYFGICHLGVDHECDGQTDGQTFGYQMLRFTSLRGQSFQRSFETVHRLRVANGTLQTVLGYRSSNDKCPFSKFVLVR